LKYILAVRGDQVPILLVRCLPILTIGLRDSSDDVRSVSAESIRPISKQIVEISQDNFEVRVQFQELLRTLWDVLAKLDHLTSSTNK
jgi:hypothetical protein